MTPMPRQRRELHHARHSKLRDRDRYGDEDTDINRCGGWSREKLERMDQRFRIAMERAMMATRPAASLPPQQRSQTRR